MKVADLKGLLQQANVSFSAKLTKPDLIQKILETPAITNTLETPAAPTEDDLVSKCIARR